MSRTTWSPMLSVTEDQTIADGPRGVAAERTGPAKDPSVTGEQRSGDCDGTTSDGSTALTPGSLIARGLRGVVAGPATTRVWTQA